MDFKIICKPCAFQRSRQIKVNSQRDRNFFPQKIFWHVKHDFDVIKC